MNDEQKWISVADAALRMDLSKRVIARWIRSGRLQSRKSADGSREVSLADVEDFQHDRFSEQAKPDAWLSKEWERDETHTSSPEETTNRATEDTTSKEAAESTREDRDPLSALEHQAERSIQVAGAAFQEAKELAAAYRDELQMARQDHREELDRVRRNGQVAWLLVAASVFLVLGGVWWIGRQVGERQLDRAQVSHLTERLGKTASDNQQLQAMIETMRSERKKAASELRAARLGQADAIGQLAAYRAHAQQLTQQVQSLETKLNTERQKRVELIQKAKRQAIDAERKRLARIRKAKAEKAEKIRQELAAKARAERERIQREQQKIIEAERKRQAQLRQQEQQKATLAQVENQHHTYRPLNDNANMKLSELESVLMRNSR